ncbi:MAG: hypothetical protein L6Q84_31520 [Polyangiaceae bacterium]|nr:hypothetical protein [Polyangiaceae bacterium]
MVWSTGSDGKRARAQGTSGLPNEHQARDGLAVFGDHDLRAGRAGLVEDAQASSFEFAPAILLGAGMPRLSPDPSPGPKAVSQGYRVARGGIERE